MKTSFVTDKDSDGDNETIRIRNQLFKQNIVYKYNNKLSWARFESSHIGLNCSLTSFKPN